MPDSSTPTQLARIKALNASLQVWRHCYYVEAKPVVTDEAYDAAERELRDLVAANPQFEVLATVLKQVGSDLAASAITSPIRHSQPMLSLDNVYTVEDLLAWADRHPAGTRYVLEPKVDGLSLSVRYADWNLWLATTRGDGSSGEDTTPQALRIPGIPHQLNHEMFPPNLEVRGEVFMTRQRFAAINAEMAAQGKEPYKTSRNLAAGTLKLHDLGEVARRDLRFQPWQIEGLNDWLPPLTHDTGTWSASPSGKQSFTPEEDEGGLATRQVTVAQTLEPHQALHWFAQNALGTRQAQVSLPFGKEELAEQVELGWRLMDGLWADIIGDVDGLVVKVSQDEVREQLGVGVKSPNWAIAVKRQSMKAVTKLIGVEWTVGRTGVLTPTGVVAPVVLGGATVQRANLCNMTRILSLGLRLGCLVEILRSGDVIPQIVRKVEPLEMENSVYP